MRTVSPGRGTRVLRLLTLGLAFAAMTPDAGFAACSGGACSAPGGGSLKSDCLVEYDGITLNSPPTRPRGVLCTDGDPACDVDGIANGACAFDVAVCLNNPDPRFPLCTAPSVSTFTLKNRPTTSPSYNAQIAALQDEVLALGLPTAGNVCTGTHRISVNLRVRSSGFRPNTVKLRSIALSSAGVKDADRVKLKCMPSATFPNPAAGFSRAEVVTHQAQLIEGPVAVGRLGDLRLYNDQIQVIIQKPGRWATAIVNIHGGNIVDADRALPPGGREADHFGAWVPAINVENIPNYTSVVVLNDGTNGSPAVVRATGVDDLHDYINASSTVAGFGFAFPPGADDRDLPVDIQTDYILEAGKDYVRVETTITNLAPYALTGNTPPHHDDGLFFAEYLSGSGQVDLWQPVYGFGEPLVITSAPGSSFQPCTTGTCDPQNLIGYIGIDGAAGKAYGYLHGFNGSTSFSTNGVTVPLVGQEAVLTLIGAAAPNFNLAASGSPGDSVTVPRYFAVAAGGVDGLLRVQQEIFGYASLGGIAGTVTSGGQPVAGADVAVTATPTPGGLGAPAKKIVAHARTDASGAYSISLPAGSYTVQANKDGYLAAAPASAPVVVAAGPTPTTQSFTLPATGALRVLVTDENGDPTPAKVNVVGFDPSPDPFNTQSILGLINNTMGVFGEEFEDGRTHGIATATFADRAGDTGAMTLEPGNYQVSVSRGPRYSAYLQNVSISGGATTTVNAQIAKVVPTPGYVAADFHVHGILSPDSEVTLEERITTQLAEGMDFFTPSDHETRGDYRSTVEAMGVQDLIATAASAEITSFDYGHFNSWPVTVDPSLPNGGTVDLGGAAPPGQDFPSSGNYNLSPAQVYAAAHADPKVNLIQINHMDSHFNAGGLDIDTAEAGTGPPQSHTPGSTRRLDPLITNYFDDGFDALEVWIGTNGRSGGLNDFLGQNLGDWINMLNQGILSTGVSSSDTHERKITQINARSMVASTVTDPALLWTEDENLAQQVVAGRVTGTNAPFMTVDVTTPLGAAGLGANDGTMVPTNDGTATVTINVKSPMWAPFDRVELYVNNAPQAYDHDNDVDTRDRYRVIPNFVHNVSPTLVDDYPAIPGAKHYETTVVQPLAGLAQDTWVIVVVRGTDGTSTPLFPVIPNTMLAQACSNNPCRACTTNANCTGGGTCTVSNQNLAELTDGNLNQCGVTALAFSNPLFIDVDQNSQYDPPGVMLTP